MRGLTFNPISDKWILRNDLSVPVPTSGQVCVKVHACGLNPVDAKISFWKGMVPTMDSNFIPGLDVYGEIFSCGPNVAEKWSIGKKVLYHGNMTLPHGGFAEYAIHDTETLIDIAELLHHCQLGEEDVDAVMLAATPCAAWTAYRALFDKLHVQSHDTLLVTGATGGVGSFALQFAREKGLSNIIAICSTKNESTARHLGATAVVDYTIRQPLEQALRSALAIPEGSPVLVDKILDCVGAASSEEASCLLSFDGVICPIISLAEPAKAGDAFSNSLVFAQLSLGAAHGAKGAAGVRARQRLVQIGKIITEAVLKRSITVPVSRVVRLDEAAQCLVEMLKANNTGKIVLSFV
jgi:NADPH2:quinone reductase